MGQSYYQNFYLQNWRWVFSSTLDLNQTTAKETTSSFSIRYIHWYFKASFIIYIVSSSLYCCFSSSLTVLFPSFNVFAKGRLRSESRQEDHVIRLWKYVCWNCISTKKKGSRKKAKQPCFIQLCWRKLRFSLGTFYRISNCEWRLGKNTNISCGLQWFNPNGLFLKIRKNINLFLSLK